MPAEIGDRDVLCETVSSADCCRVRKQSAVDSAFN